ncbi:MAG: hypothetical protein AB1467_04470 [Candidatus Diapherotrites archaeon]
MNKAILVGLLLIILIALFGCTQPSGQAVTPAEELNVLPTAEAGGPYTGGVNKWIQLTGKGSDNPNGVIKSIEWSADSQDCFVDEPSIVVQGKGMPDAVNYSFIACSTTGTFNATLTVTDNSDGTTTAKAQVIIE